MISRQFFVRCFLLLVVVEIEESCAQFTSEMSEKCSRVSSSECGHLEISDQIRSQRKILENVAKSIQTMKTPIDDLSHEVESNVKNLSREIESKLESVQLQYSELKSECKSSMKSLSHDVESNLKNLSRHVGSSMMNLSREVESKLESVQLGSSKLKFEIEQLRNQTINCSSDQTTKVSILVWSH